MMAVHKLPIFCTKCGGKEFHVPAKSGDVVTCAGCGTIAKYTKKAIEELARKTFGE
jgi:hypothetical protein